MSTPETPLTRTRPWAALALLVPLGACSTPPDPAAPPGGRGGPAPLGSFSGSVDLRRGTLTFDGSSVQGLGRLPVDRDGVPGSGRSRTVELVTTSAGDGVAGPCGHPSQFGGVVQLNSFFPEALENLAVQIEFQSPVVGYEAQNSDPDFMGLSSTLGLWTYPAPGTSRTWCFSNHPGTTFTFRGTVWGDVIEPCAGWLTQWQYRTPIVITNSGPTLVLDYQIFVQLDMLARGGKIDPTGADLRATADDGVTLLPLWIEPRTLNSVATQIWVRVPSVPVGTSVVYLYYGYTGATPIASVSDESATMAMIIPDRSFETMSGWLIDNPNLETIGQSGGHPSAVWPTDGGFSVFASVGISEGWRNGNNVDIYRTLTFPNPGAFDLVFDAYISLIEGSSRIGHHLWVCPNRCAIGPTASVPAVVGPHLNRETTSPFAGGSTVDVGLKTGLNAVGENGRISAYVDNLRVRRSASPKPILGHEPEEESTCP